MDETFDLLEGRIRKAADLVQKLRNDNARLAADLEKARKTQQEADKRLHALEKRAAPAEDLAPKVEALTRDVERLSRERDEIRTRIERLVSALDEIG